MTAVVRVSIPNTYHDFFDYIVNDMPIPCVGARVRVPFRKQVRLGIVVGVEDVESPRPTLKMIDSVLDETPLLTGELLALCFWVSDYYQSPLSEVIPLALPKKYRMGEEGAPPLTHVYALTVPVIEAHARIAARAIRQHQCIDFLATTQSPIYKKNLSQAGFTSAHWGALVNVGIVSVQEDIARPLPSPNPPEPPLALNEEQALAVDAISAHLHDYQAFLLQGVTGSGKTEVYLQVIAKVLALGRQVLILVPEIGLTPQLLQRFRARFSQPMAVIHSGLNDTERQLAWRYAQEEQVKLVIGTRAAIFTPMPALGLIVIDEEHDASLKQMDGVRYSARDTALMRAHLRHIPIVLGTATPSLESCHNAHLKKYQLLRLDQKALNSAPLHYQILDIRHQALVHGMASTTLDLIRTHLENKNQVLVFINRRGYAPVLLCHQCGWMADCRACDAHLTMHRGQGKLICHHCGTMHAIPTTCRQCQGHELLPIGVGTQRIHEYLSAQFPEVGVVRIDRDEVRKKQAFDACLAAIHRGDTDLIIGTQMLAKGHHFPRLSLVVVLDTDNGFYNQDFRALERLGQLLTQVAGRAGRAEHPGQVLIQTHVPQHPLLNVLVQQGYEAFAQALLTMRQAAALPPYTFLTLIRAQDKTPSKVLAFLHHVKDTLQTHDITVMGPAPAPLARKAGYHRMQLLVKASSRKQLKAALIALRHSVKNDKIGAGVRWSMDVDPLDLS